MHARGGGNRKGLLKQIPGRLLVHISSDPARASVACFYCPSHPPRPPTHPLRITTPTPLPNPPTTPLPRLTTHPQPANRTRQFVTAGRGAADLLTSHPDQLRPLFVADHAVAM